MEPEESLTVGRAKELLARSDLPEDRKAEILREVELSCAVQAVFLEASERFRGGERIGWEELLSRMDQVALEHGHEGGLPMPHVTDDGLEHRLVLADRSPLSWTSAANLTTEEAERLARLRICVKNSWEQLGDFTVTIVETDEGLQVLKNGHAGIRLRKMFGGLGIRHDVPTMTADAELRALDSLRTKVRPHQYDQYILSGAFLERSPRSDLTYMFRKGLPTLAISGHGSYENGCRVIACLCLHPFGYYEGTHVGVLTPTDEVIAALLFMRGDEAKFWAKSGQWSASDPRSGI